MQFFVFVFLSQKVHFFIRNSGDFYRFLFLNHILYTYNKNKNHVLFVNKNIYFYFIVNKSFNQIIKFVNPIIKIKSKS